MFWQHREKPTDPVVYKSLWPHHVSSFSIPFSPTTIKCESGTIFVHGAEVLIGNSVIVTGPVGATIEIWAGEEGGVFSWSR